MKFTEEELRDYLRKKCKARGSRDKVMELCGIKATFLSRFLTGKVKIGIKIPKGLRLKKVVIYVPEDDSFIKQA